MRQYGEVPPWLSTAAAPAVSATTGLGTGGGAGVQTKDGQGFGTVEIVAGNNAAVGGSVVLAFPSLPPLMFFSTTDAFGALSSANNPSTSITISWTAQLKPGRHIINYEWAVSK